MNSWTRVLHIGLVGVTIILGSCASTSSNPSSFRDLKTEVASERLGTAVLAAPSCPVAEAEEFGPIVGFLAAFGAEFAVRVLQDAIKEYKDGLTGQFVATGVDPRGGIVESGGVSS